MGFQHGTLLRDAARRGPVPLYARYLGVMFRNSPIRAVHGPLQRFAEDVVVPRFVRRLPDYVRAELAGFADGAALPERDVLRAAVVADTMLYVFAGYGRLNRVPLAPGCPSPPPLGCTSAVAGRSCTRRGELLHGRNLDFVGVGRWDAEPTVAFHDPDHGRRFVSVTSAGVCGGGVTAMNDAGVTCAVHMHFPRELDYTGTPVGVVGDEVMRGAGSVDEAIEILDCHRPIAAWTYIVADAQRAIAYEVAPGLRRVVEMTDDRLGYANAYVHPDMQAVEHNFYPLYFEANDARHRRVDALLRADDAHTEASVIRMLDDHHDPGLDETVELGNTIATPYTVSSVVFRPADRRLWVSEGPAPTSAGPFVGFDLSQRGPSGKPRLLQGPDRRDGERLRALHAYCDAFRQFTEGDDPVAARDRLREVVALRPHDAVIRHVAGLLELKCGSPAAASDHLRAALRYPHTRSRLARLHLALARTLDVVGDRATARAEYHSAIATGDREVRAAARRGRMSPFTLARARRLEIEFIYGDVL